MRNVKKFISLLSILMVLVIPSKAYALDISNYNIDGMDMLSDEEMNDFQKRIQYLPDYFLNCYLKNGGQIKFVNYQLYGADNVGGLYTYRKDDNNYSLIEVRVNPEMPSYIKDIKNGARMADTLVHELGHYYGIKYTDKLSEESKREMQRTAEYDKKYKPVSCYNADEAFAEEFAIMYGEVGEKCWGTNYSVPYDELEIIVKTEMGIEDTSSRIKGEVKNVY